MEGKQFPRKEMNDGSWGSVLWFRAKTDTLEASGRTHHWAGEKTLVGV